MKQKISSKIKDSVEKVIDSIGVEFDNEVHLEHPADSSHGDYSTNIAMVLFSQIKKGGGDEKEYSSPRELAGDILQKLEEDDLLQKNIERMEIAGPGFINFYLSEEFLLKEATKVLELKDDYGKGTWGKGKRMLIDYSSPNIAKKFGVGHLRSTVIGQAIYNLYKFSGWECVGDNHLGDWGTQFGMIIAAVEQKNLDVEKLNVNELEELYVDFNKQIDKDLNLKDKARDAFLRLEKGEENARDIWRKSIEISIEEFNKIYKLLDVEIDYAYGESHYEKYVYLKLLKNVKRRMSQNTVRALGLLNLIICRQLFW